ncbi:hypothetical protein HY310_02095, partial [Candidatus Microgenomates bacterium]|nr:hypothetical protein [Candidatus Microgenomates bacterium]
MSKERIKIVIGSAFLLLLTIGIGAGVYFGVNKNQDIRSKASTFCDGRWPADPTTDCGKKTQIPAQNASNISLTPDFHWDYGGYRPADNNQCI